MRLLSMAPSDETASDNKAGLQEQTVKPLADDPTGATLPPTVPQIQLCSCTSAFRHP